MSKNNLYIHIPFCEKVCPYCDFYKMVASDNLKEKYLKAVLEESKLKNIDFYALESLYVGGGTPSCIPLNLLEDFLFYISSKLNKDNLKEFTFEINPSDINYNLLNILKKSKVNRLSIGVQSFNKDIQNLINRPLDYLELKEKINLIYEFGFTNYSFDLMYGFENESVSTIKDDIDKLVSLDPKHISIYCLIIEDHSIFGYLYNKNCFKASSEEDEEKQYFFIIDYLSKLGFNQYEISNFSKEGFQSIHNLVYWNGDDYECLGAGASSYLLNTHYKTTKKIYDYIDSLNNFIMPNREIEYLDLDEAIDEYIIMNLRKTIGLNLIKFKDKFNIDFFELFNCKPLLKNNYLIKENNYLYIPKKYLFVENNIIVKLISSRKDKNL